MKNISLPISTRLSQSTFRHVLSGAMVALSVIACPSIQAQFSDNFNSGNDSAWTHWAPTTSPSPAGTPLSPSYGFPASTQGGLGYQMSSITSTGGLNAYVRVGSYVTGLVIADFLVSADLIDWDPTKGQNMGVMARVTTPIAGILPNGYGFGYVNRRSATGGGTDQLRIYNLATAGQINADPNGVANGNVGQFMTGANPAFTGGSPSPLPTGDYRLVFWGSGNNLYGQMIDLGTGLPVLVSDGNGGVTDTVRSVNSLYTSGSAGLFSFTQSGGLINPTFDNFSASVVPEPSTLALTALGFLGLALRNIRRSHSSLL